MLRHPHLSSFTNICMENRWDEEAMLKRELAKLHTWRGAAFEKRVDAQLARNGNSTSTNRACTLENSAPNNGFVACLPVLGAHRTSLPSLPRMDPTPRCWDETAACGKDLIMLSTKANSKSDVLQFRFLFSFSCSVLPTKIDNEQSRQ